MLDWYPSAYAFERLTIGPSRSESILPLTVNRPIRSERFNRTYRNEVLDTWLFRNLGEVRELTWAWMLEYKEQRDHDGLGGLIPAEALEKARVSTFELST